MSGIFKKILHLASLFLLGIFTTLITAIVYCYFAFIHQQLPPWSIFDDEKIFTAFPFSVKIFSLEKTPEGLVNTLTGEYYQSERRFLIRKDQLPELRFLITSLLALEDRFFYVHPGINPLAVLQAIIDHYVHKQAFRGASTITQQLVKNVLYRNGYIDVGHRSVEQKIQEIYLAVALERRLRSRGINPKEHVLWLYLNTVPMGGINGGFAAAAYQYFGIRPEHLHELTTDQALALAALPRRPEMFVPAFNHQHADHAQAFARLHQRIRYAARTLYQQQQLRSDEYDRIYEHLVLPTRSVGKTTNCNEFTSLIIHALESPAATVRYGRPLSVTTTCDPTQQRFARAQLAFQSRHIQEHSDHHDEPQAAAIFMESVGEHRGEITVLVGDIREPTIGGLNRIFSGRPAGSTFKMLVYYLALLDGQKPDTLVSTSPTCLASFVKKMPLWCPKNIATPSQNVLTLTEALATSTNASAVRTTARINARHKDARYTVREMIRLLSSVGVRTMPNDFQPSFILGPTNITALQLTTLSHLFVHDGKYLKPRFVRRCYDELGERYCDLGSIMDYEERVVANQNAARDLAVMLQATGKNGGTARKVGAFMSPYTVALKSGTSQDARDAWLTGCSPLQCGTVWYGFDRPKSLGKNPETGEEWYGARTAGPVWGHIARFRIEPPKARTVARHMPTIHADNRTAGQSSTAH